MSKRHIHAEVIHAWAEGEEVQMNCYGRWVPVGEQPQWLCHIEYRIKPKLVKKEGWLNIYSEQDIDLFQTRKEADDNAVYGRKACIHITWEEEE